MVERSAASAARAMEGTVIAGDPAVVWRGAALDSRRVTGREIFFALPGEVVDGHDFVDQALERGAAAVVIHRRGGPPTRTRQGSAWLRVADTYDALHALTRAVRAQVPERLVGITGSVGKTTTKELLAAMLGRRFSVERSRGNFNNTYGFPFSLLNIRDGCQWMVAEMGMSTPGELRQVSRLGRPDVAVFINVRPAHLENFHTLRAIAEAKAELLAGLAAGGLVVANADDPEVMGIVARHRAAFPRRGTSGEHPADGTRFVFFGMEDGGEGREEMAVLASRPEILDDGRTGSRFVLTAGEESVPVELPIHGLYNVENCLAAATCAHALGVPLADIAAAVVDLPAARMRGEVHRRGGLTVIDDSYNSNPDAAAKALESARRLPATRYVAVLGDMLELGPEAPSFHRRLGERAADLGFDRVIGVGPLARDTAAAARRGGAATEHLADAARAVEWASSALAEGDLREGDLVLVKGSRGIGLERVVEALVGREEGG